MSGSTPNNTAALNYQKEQDTLAQQKEALRQQRIAQGTAAVKAIYEGSPVMGNRNRAFDWSNWGNQTSQFGTYASAGGQINGTQVPGMPAGYTYKVIPGTSTTVATAPGQSASAAAAGGAGAGTIPYDETVGNARERAAGNISTNPNVPGYQKVSTNVSTNPNAPNYAGGGGATSTGATSYGIVGPDGKVYKQGDPLNYNESYDTGQRTGGFNDAFYNKYNQAYQDMYNTDEQRSYNYAKQKLLYNAGDQGITNSTAMGGKLNELQFQDTKNKGKIIGDASTATANLRNTIDTQKANILNQLYSTEDPDIASTAAQSSAKADQLQTPTLTPGAVWFDPVLSTLGGYTSNLMSPYRSGAGGAAPAGNVPASGPTPASSNASSGKLS